MDGAGCGLHGVRRGGSLCCVVVGGLGGVGEGAAVLCCVFCCVWEYERECVKKNVKEGMWGLAKKAKEGGRKLESVGSVAAAAGGDGTMCMSLRLRGCVHS